MKNRNGAAVILVFAATLFSASCKKEAGKYPPVIPPPVDTMTHQKKWIVTTVAGSGNPFFLDGPALDAKFRLPLDVAAAEDGTLYVADGLNHRIRKISGGIVSSFAGSGVQDTTNANGLAAGFSIPAHITIDPSGNLYILDILDARVRKLTTGANVSTLAGTVAVGFADGPVIDSKFGRCFGIVADAAGRIYISDAGNKRIRKISNGQVATIAGTGLQGFKDGSIDSAEFFFLQGIVVDAQGNLFVADQTKIRKISPAGIVSTFAGNESIGFADGGGDQAMFTDIEDLVIDVRGNIYASDNNRIRKISPQAVVTTIAGSIEGYEDGEGTMAKFNGAIGLGIDRQGNIYVADADNSRIRKISFQ